jgi:hypothetical protein
VLIDAARQDGDFAKIVAHLESMIGQEVVTSGDTRPYIDSPLSLVAAFSLIRILELTGDTDRAIASKDASIAFVQRRTATTRVFASTHPEMLARTYLWQGEREKALAALETIPGAHMRHAWYLERAPVFQELHDLPRFKAVVDAVKSSAAEYRDQLAAFGDDLPPCVANMRTMTR